ncbi:GNAT family N-acetyltransferase [Terribacillus goriensis]|uniref:GNAT family N-acetyltransferase n=1 Tax=Terribacillus saccharophilus TaxID=361277 RepID=UPI003982EAAA
MAIRKMRLSDNEEIARLTAQLGYDVEKDTIKDRLATLICLEDHQVYVAEVESCLAGWVHIYGKHLIELEYAEIGGLVIDQEYRKRNLGTQLMEKCEGWAKANRYREIRLRSGAQRTDAHKFYQKIGYQNIKSQSLFIKSII